MTRSFRDDVVLLLTSSKLLDGPPVAVATVAAASELPPTTPCIERTIAVHVAIPDSTLSMRASSAPTPWPKSSALFSTSRSATVWSSASPGRAMGLSTQDWSFTQSTAAVWAGEAQKMATIATQKEGLLVLGISGLEAG